MLAAIDDEIAAKVIGPPRPDKAACFEDQYVSTGGQLYGLMAGQDRFVADLTRRSSTGPDAWKFIRPRFDQIT